MKILDCVNFNPDASCLSSSIWMETLTDKQNGFLQWVTSIADNGNSVVFGMCGSVLADISKYCPTAIKVFCDCPEVFSFACRPFSHDLSYMRTAEGAYANLELGVKALKYFDLNLIDLYMPPEFMVTTRDLLNLKKLGISTVLLNPKRFPDINLSRSTRLRINSPNIQMTALSCNEGLTESYLKILHGFDYVEKVAASPSVQVIWRDGESWLFAPGGLKNEITWENFKKEHFVSCNYSEIISELPICEIEMYPRHNLEAWSGQFKLVDYVRTVQNIEENMDYLKLDDLNAWLYLINSDILSSVEKDDVKIDCIVGGFIETCKLKRQNKIVDAELIALSLFDSSVLPIDLISDGVFRKLQARNYLLNLILGK